MRVIAPSTFILCFLPLISIASAFQIQFATRGRDYATHTRTSICKNPFQRSTEHYLKSPPFSSSLYKNIQMDEQLSKATSNRISALFLYKEGQRGGDSAGTTTATKRDFSTKNRSKELKRLAQSMNVNVSQLKGMLKNQRSKLQNGSEKADYVDWILTKEPKKKKRERNNSEVMEEKKTSEGGPGSVQASSAKAPRKKIRPARPQRGESNVNGNESSGDEEMEGATTMESTTAAIQDTSLLSNMKFQDVTMNKNSKRAIAQVLKLEYMTEIQSKTFETASKGRDVLGRARTGTGKTMAFLLPALERVLTSNNYDRGNNIGVLIISPTRELAIQIGDQAEKLLTFHRDLSCYVMYGGTKMGRDVNRLNKKLPSILVATPGRLLDHLENTNIGGRKFGYDIMRETGILVLDETDRLLDMGFRREISKIMAYLPKQEKRQTLLFSATVPAELKKIMAENMKKDFIEVDCIKDGGNSEPGQHTNTLVDQTYAVLPNLDNIVTAVVQVVESYMNKDSNSKIVVFFPVARMVGYFAQFFNQGLGIDVIEIHSKKSQSQRNKASEKFRKARRAVMFTSDVSARGVDYPDVTAVIQVGLPENREQYIHRLGRTGRAGKKGEGLLLLAPFEQKFLSELKKIDIQENVEASNLIASVDAKTMQSVNNVLQRIRSGDAALTQSAEQCYAAFIGYYNGQMKRVTLRSKDELVSTANALAKVLGCKDQPSLTKRAAGKMGLKGVKGLKLISEQELRKNNGGQQRNRRR